MMPTSTHNDTGGFGFQTLIAKHNITMTTQYLGPNAIQSGKNQWLITFRRDNGRRWTVRYCAGANEGVCAALRCAESAAVPAHPEVLDTMLNECRYSFADFAEFVVAFNECSVPEPGDEVIQKSILLQTAGLEQFFEGVELPPL